MTNKYYGEYHDEILRWVMARAFDELGLHESIAEERSRLKIDSAIVKTKTFIKLQEAFLCVRGKK